MTVDRRIIDLYNEYVHTALPRREFMTRLASIAGGSAAGPRMGRPLPGGDFLLRQRASVGGEEAASGRRVMARRAARVLPRQEHRLRGGGKDTGDDDGGGEYPSRPGPHGHAHLHLGPYYLRFGRPLTA